MATATSTSPKTSPTRRELARALLDPQSGGVAAYVQECVHSTSIGVDATFVFLLQVIEELDDAISEFLPSPPNYQPLVHDNEVELGTLLSAASLTIRYVTERQAMIPLLPRYRDAFNTVLQYPVWTHKCYYGLKAVALMGSTRVLESFSDQVPVSDVLMQLRWLFPLFKDESITAEEKAQRMNALLRPSCEFATVALQTHVGVRESIFAEILPQLLELLIKEGGNRDTTVAEAVKVELATTVAVLLEAKFPYTPPNAFALLSLPAFVEEMEADESKLSTANAMFAPTAEAKSETVDEEEEKASSVAVVKRLEEECCKVLCSWLEVDTRRMTAAQALAVMYRVIASGPVFDSVANSATSFTTPLDEMTKALNDAELIALPDFDFINALLESIRDICLFQHKLAATTLEGAFQAMSTVMPRLETALTSFKRQSAERRNAKAACSAIRHTLVETFLAWLHHPDAANLLTSQVDFLHNVAGTLADPRVYGDVLAVLRVSTVPEARAEYASCRQLAVVTLCQAINQLDRYSKSTANRIVSGLTRIAAACREDIHPLANELVLPLLPSMLDGSQWGKFLRLRTEAVATVLVGCAESDDFQMEKHPWISDFTSFLLDPVVSSENVHSFMILCGLIRAEHKLLLHVVSFCMANPHAVTQTLHEPLARWPLYEEDVDLVVVTLELLEALLSVNTLRQSVDVDVIYATILQLSENAASEGLDVISSVCNRVIASLGTKH
ncbi:hypothetical protein F441_16953 [Phytophthora nicotianae CJ01A1]|uniref:Uncharacterized protein n=10 Tax=Phytophthora nicotianae TaxID=4792 RepID=W2PN18_PHYN3|nr:hypothetical protein PPTG_16590 [Phytophthora nicotianae INRA-310]ETI36833.1 hypothetical protein F443_17093 [Phytophthora nicotianae P1569]ETL30529.1 hypothetical protein L916_16522 [Phytophthora nicotianae]ETP06685.1 hypothetical protein F441_16953 [Phytophthora nicotianae CJ01A1]ETP34813.1 hypothetical protein F442_16951 [Phytophthora nicotianae P10297]KUF90098.1 hypothetical protein AM587_10017029 [Phytophthora nicotianae]